jgi:hypothetical protein
MAYQLQGIRCRGRTPEEVGKIKSEEPQQAFGPDDSSRKCWSQRKNNQFILSASPPICPLHVLHKHSFWCLRWVHSNPIYGAVFCYSIYYKSAVFFASDLLIKLISRNISSTFTSDPLT